MEPCKLRLHFHQSPGDTVVATTSLRMLHEQYPGRYQTDVSGVGTELFENNPFITRLGHADTITMHNPLINECDRRPVHFLDSYCHQLSTVLGIRLQCTMNRPDLYLSPEERSWIGQVEEVVGKRIPYWLVCAGVKKDYTVKGWGSHNYQRVVDILRGKVQCVQVGAGEHCHPSLDGCIDLRGKTDLRQLVRLVWHAQGGIGPESLLHHLFAAFSKPYVCLLSGFLPRSWVAYPSATILSRQAQMACCQVQDKGCCWRSRTVPLGDGDSKDGSLCALPVIREGLEAVPKCLALITPEEVAGNVIAHYEGGRLLRN